MDKLSLCGAHNPGGSREPLGLAWISIVHSVEDEFHARGDAQFLEDPKEIFLDGVLAQVEFARNLAVPQSLGHECHYLFFAGREQIVAVGIQNSQRRHLRDEIDEVVQLFAAGPDLSGGHAEQAFAEKTQVRIGDAKDASCT